MLRWRWLMCHSLLWRIRGDSSRNALLDYSGTKVSQVPSYQGKIILDSEYSVLTSVDQGAFAKEVHARRRTLNHQVVNSGQ